MIRYKRFIKILTIILIAMILLTANVYATNDSYKTTISATKTQIKGGDSITITIGLKDINIESGEKGIGAYTAVLEYDTSVFEFIEANATSGWELLCREDEQGLLIVGNTSDAEVVNTDQNVGTFTLKVKDDAKRGETKIALKNFSAATMADEELKTTDNYLTFSVIEDEPVQEPEYKLGDIDGNGKINLTDLVKLQRHLIAGTTKPEWILTGKAFKAGDMNKSGKITSTDLVLLKRVILKQLLKVVQ